MSALASFTGLPVAFKLATALPVFLLPLFAYLAFRSMRLAFPAPLLAAAAAVVFLFVEDTPIWGGSIASTLAGEFSYTYGVGLALLFLGVLVRARLDGRGPFLPGLVLALTAYAHGYAVLWAGLTASGLLLFDPARRRVLSIGDRDAAVSTPEPSGPGDEPGRARGGRAGSWVGAGADRVRLLGYLAAVALIGFALAAPSVVPLLGDWGWTTPYDDAWIDVTTQGLLPPLLRPLLALGLAGVVATLVAPWAGRRSDPRVLLLGFGAAAGAALAAAGPGLGVIDVRFVPLAQLSLALAGAAALGPLLERFRLREAAALGLVLLAVAWADSRVRVVRHWVDWNYSGLEAKELWPAWRELTQRLRGSVADPRVAVEYSPIHERAGSIRMYETLPFFSGRSTLEGVYNQAAATTHPVYYLASELFARSPNPFRSRTYSSFDPESALARLRLFNVSEIVVLSPELDAALAVRGDVVREAQVPPYTVYRLRDPGPGYVEPLAWAPVRADPAAWRDLSYRWFSRKPANRALLVFTRDARFDLALPDPWALPPERPLSGGVEVSERVEPESIRITTSRPGHPLLVKVSYHPRWRAEGADGPYLVSPGLMMVIPRQREVRLAYEGRTWTDRLGRTLFLAAVAAGLAMAAHARRPRSARRAAPLAARRRPGLGILLALVPLLALAGLASLRMRPRPQAAVDLAWLDERASQAFSEERWEEAAEYARHATERLEAGDPRRYALLNVRGEALLRAGHARLAVEAFARVVNEAATVYRAQALFSGALAREAIGDAAGAAQWRRSLRADHPRTPWARRLGE
jgi:hypothetical protein